MIRDGSSELRFAVPYEVGKVPVVFVHGLLGSPSDWSVMIDQLSADPAVCDRTQFLTFRYDSLQPIPDALARCPLWIAHYRSTKTPWIPPPGFRPFVPPPWTDWTIHQYSGNGGFRLALSLSGVLPEAVQDK